MVLLVEVVEVPTLALALTALDRLIIAEVEVLVVTVLVDDVRMIVVVDLLNEELVLLGVTAVEVLLEEVIILPEEGTGPVAATFAFAVDAEAVLAVDEVIVLLVVDDDVEDLIVEFVVVDVTLDLEVME